MGRIAGEKTSGNDIKVSPDQLTAYVSIRIEKRRSNTKQDLKQVKDS